MFTTTAASAAEPKQEATTSAAEADDPEECGWCKWMKGGACREQFQVSDDKL